MPEKGLSNQNRFNLSLPLEAILRSYSIIFFSDSLWLGAILLASTFIVPAFGFTGLIGIIISFTAAHLLSFDEKELKSGSYLFNSLLISFAIASLSSYYRLNYMEFATLIILIPVVTLLLTVSLNRSMLHLWNLPSMSLPFVIVGFILYFLFFALKGAAVQSSPPATLFPLIRSSNPSLQGLLEAFSAIFFLPNALMGMIIVIGLLFTSRLSLIFGITGFITGVFFLHVFHMDTSPLALTYISFNFIFCAIAVGGIFFIPSRSSLLLIILGSFLCVITAVATKTLLFGWGVPPLALPLNLATILIIHSLRMRVKVNRFFPTVFLPGSPEQNMHRFHTNTRRFPDINIPHLRLPFFGERTITQGFDGSVTHTGNWKYALDLEVLDETGKKYEGNPIELTSYFSFNTPVLSPSNGIVVKTVEHVEDNIIEASNLDDNWGNLVMIYTDQGLYTMLCHLKKGSITVKEGDRVRIGETIARCGNSGRSPVPHLHMQAQLSSQIGAKTVAFTFSRFVEIMGKEKIFHASGIPVQGSLIKSLEFDKQMTSCFDMLAGKTFKYKVKTPSSEYIDEIRCNINDTGIIEFHSNTFGTSLTARIADGVFYTLDFSGDEQSILIYFWLGLCQVPMTLDEQIAWTDRMAVHPLLKEWAKVVLDFTGPFFTYPFVNVRINISKHEAEAAGMATIATVISRLSYNSSSRFTSEKAPQTIETTIGPQQGVIYLKADLSSGTTEASRIID